jgi:hypothetical protein
MLEREQEYKEYKEYKNEELRKNLRQGEYE